MWTLPQVWFFPVAVVKLHDGVGWSEGSKWGLATPVKPLRKEWGLKNTYYKSSFLTHWPSSAIFFSIYKVPIPITITSTISVFPKIHWLCFIHLYHTQPLKTLIAYNKRYLINLPFISYLVNKCTHNCTWGPLSTYLMYLSISLTYLLCTQSYITSEQMYSQSYLRAFVYLSHLPSYLINLSFMYPVVHT